MSVCLEWKRLASIDSTKFSGWITGTGPCVVTIQRLLSNVDPELVFTLCRKKLWRHTNLCVFLHKIPMTVYPGICQNNFREKYFGFALAWQFRNVPHALFAAASRQSQFSIVAFFWCISFSFFFHFHGQKGWFICYLFLVNIATVYLS